MDSNDKKSLIYTIRDLKKDFGIDNIIREETSKNEFASVDVVLRRDKVNIIKELEKIGLVLFGTNKCNDGSHTFLLDEHPGFNICTIIEHKEPGNFILMVQQPVDQFIGNTIVCYITKYGEHYRLNHWDK